MIEFIVGAVAGIYVYKRYEKVRNLYDKYIYNSLTSSRKNYYNIRYKIVEFDKDKYSIRRDNIFFYTYFDMDTRNHWWDAGQYPEDTRKDLKTCKSMYNQYIFDNKKTKENKHGKPI